MPIVVRSKDDLELLLQPDGMLRSFRKPRLLIRIPELSASETRTWERRLENIRQQCGCTAGALALGAFAFLFVAYSLHNDFPAPGNFRLTEIVLGGGCFVGGLILSALVGKFLALCVATVQFRRTCVELHNRLHDIS